MHTVSNKYEFDSENAKKVLYIKILFLFRVMIFPKHQHADFSWAWCYILSLALNEIKNKDELGKILVNLIKSKATWNKLGGTRSKLSCPLDQSRSKQT